jgi:hypothetical protein
MQRIHTRVVIAAASCSGHTTVRLPEGYGHAGLVSEGESSKRLKNVVLVGNVWLFNP